QTQYDSSGIYSVALTASVKGCIKTKVKEIKVFEFPDIQFLYSNLSACDSLEVDFEAENISGKEISFDWYFYDGVQLSGNPVKRMFNSSGSYPYRLSVGFLNNQCMKDYYDTVLVNVYIPPDADYMILNSNGEDVTDRTDKGVKAKEVVSFLDQSIQNDGQIVEWIWNFGDKTIDTSRVGGQVSHVYTTTSGIVTTNLHITDEYGCESEATHNVLVLEALSFPNIFSPNNDGINDFFCPLEILGYFESFEMVIYSKWGAKVWQRNCKDPNCPNYEDEHFWWDGKNKLGQNVAEGVYYWVVFAVPKSQTNTFVLNGSVTLVR
ncbi:MAG: PKD domain-containing protein, partial [Bacteroidales bacterium]|nr:PKD domain-containing protein [Bacteroidales bacterium]